MITENNTHCQWKQDRHYHDNWDTTCGEYFSFDYAPPYEMGSYKFCPNCGKRIAFFKYKPEDDEE